MGGGTGWRQCREGAAVPLGLCGEGERHLGLIWASEVAAERVAQSYTLPHQFPSAFRLR